MTFGPESAKHTMVLFTYGDRLSKRTIQDFLRHSRALQAFIHQCHDRYHVFNNEDMENHSQVPELLQKIDEMVEENGGGCYTNKMYKEAEAAIQAKIQKGKSREEAEKDNGFLKKVFIVTGRTVVAKVIAAVGAAAGGADELAITVSDKCTIQ
ncbi:hypothetical protein AAFF_G00390710 [Aldrovandia affinis]|uniref:AIG1-type G domain-containing protein n=1 Tax=Aldrovandia affinis TaxID=143900 RepID=A0AAD7VY71_9TELE|nr:hypothetical protein AAFF_G00390710 [Aldrovandia affinis]